MRALVLALIVVCALPAAAAQAGPWHHFHLNLGKRLGNKLRGLHHHHRYSHYRHHR